MQNLAGVEKCNYIIDEELKKAGLPVLIVQRTESEVPYSIIGVLGSLNFKPLPIPVTVKEAKKNYRFTFTRAWYYWVVTGPVPLSIARKLYEHPTGKKEVRVAGHCGCPPPDQPSNDSFRRFLWAKPYEGLFGEESYAIWTYHIDSQAGLNLFVEMVKKHGLDGKALTKQRKEEIQEINRQFECGEIDATKLSISIKEEFNIIETSFLLEDLLRPGKGAPIE